MLLGKINYSQRKADIYMVLMNSLVVFETMTDTELNNI